MCRWTREKKWMDSHMPVHVCTHTQTRENGAENHNVM